MKKTLLMMLFSLLFAGVSFAYLPTQRDEVILDKLYQQIDILQETNELRVHQLYEKLQVLVKRYDGRLFYLLDNLRIYVRDSINDLHEPEDDAIPYWVMTVYRGDSVRVRYARGQFDVRLLGVSVPAVGTKERSTSITMIRNATQNEKMQLSFDENLPKGAIDEQGYFFAHLFVDEQPLVLELLEKGFLLVDDRYEHRFSEAYREAQQKAQNAQVGIWSVR